MLRLFFCFFFFKQKTAYEMRISDWSSDVCSSDLLFRPDFPATRHVSVDDRRWIGAAMRAIITSDRPEISRLHLAGAGRQDLGGGLIDEQPRARQQVRFHPASQAAEPGSGSACPVTHGSPVDLNALTPQDRTTHV